MLLCEEVQSQNLVTGRVLDIFSNKPVENATVIRLKDSLEMKTNSAGYFQLKLNASHQLTIQKPGYHDAIIPSPVQARLIIKLEPLEIPNADLVDSEYERGKILEGYKVGVWEYFDEPGELSLKVDYTRNQILFQKRDTTEVAIKIDDDFKMISVNRHPRYIGSKNEFYSIFARNMHYPPKAREKGITGTVYVLFDIDTIGKANNFQIINDLGYGSGEAAVNALKQVPNHWIPALVNNESRISRLCLPVIFNIKGNTYGSSKKSNQDSLPVAKMLSEIVITTGRMR